VSQLGETIIALGQKEAVDVCTAGKRDSKAISHATDAGLSPK
jgi:hypothetical protein